MDTHHLEIAPLSGSTPYFKSALNATWQCLFTCGLSGAAGLVISSALGFPHVLSITISVLLAYFSGIAWGVRAEVEAGNNWRSSLKPVIRGEGVSITVMESTEVLTELMIPGMIAAPISDSMFWMGITSALSLSFMATLPVNYYLIKRGIRHSH